MGVAAPGPVLDVAAFADIARDPNAFLAPAFRLSVHRTSQADVDVTQTTASFVWTFARAEACPWRFDLARSLALRPCALVDGGALSGDGGGGVGFRAATHLRPWVAAGSLGRLEWVLVGPLALEAEGGLTVPLLRETFAFDSAVNVYTPPAVVGFGSLGLGARFP
jgi:hypothetical protein